ncbi:hypothetical protein [Serratia rubidaea]|uniref:hypothetical protein n=1 Tax=Serratia rubidaea TaxID=61652 RepID=UPI00130EC42B|nr:hypothetical protein [Serratia rubidaea]
MSEITSSKLALSYTFIRLSGFNLGGVTNSPLRNMFTTFDAEGKVDCFLYTGGKSDLQEAQGYLQASKINSLCQRYLVDIPKG